MQRHILLFAALVLLGTLKVAAQRPLLLRSASSVAFFSLRPLPQNFYKQGLSFFCRQEVKLQKATTLPLYFRLGAKDYVDYLEQKPNAPKPAQ